MPTALIVSPHFPPSTLAGVHRARHLVKHLPAHGWRAKVICVDPVHHIERLDQDLAALVPADAPIIKVGALPVAFTRPFGVAGDIGLRGLLQIRATIKAEMTADRPDVVMITGSPYYPMLLAGWIERRWGVPVVLDFQDPWVTPVGATAKLGSKAWLAHQLAITLEPKVVQNAAFITSVSDRQNEELADRYPFLNRLRMAGIPIGGDPDDFSVLKLNTIHQKTTSRERFSIVYTGTVWSGAIPILETFLSGLSSASKSLDENCGSTECVFMGTTANPNALNEYRVIPLATKFSIDSVVKEIPERRPYIEAVEAMSNASVNLIIGSTEPHYTASKIYPILMTHRPYLSILHRKSSSHRILSKAGGGIALAFETQDELEALAPKIADALVTLATKPESVGQADAAAYADYTAYAVAGRFATIFDRLQAERRSGELRFGTA
jgi:glycosyltransferase involved in cell wall biosynthesis